jgi:hypothetical protein
MSRRRPPADPDPQGSQPDDTHGQALPQPHADLLNAIAEAVQARPTAYLPAYLWLQQRFSPRSLHKRDRDPAGNGEVTTPVFLDDYSLCQCLIRAAAALTKEGLGRSDDREENALRDRAIVLLACLLWSRKADQFHPAFASFCDFDMRWGTGWEEKQKLQGRAWAHEEEVLVPGKHLYKNWMALVDAAWKRVQDAAGVPAPSPAEARPDTPPPCEPDNVMLKDGHFWRVRYLGRGTSVKHVTGMDYIARLLSRANDEPIPAAELDGTDSQSLPHAETNAGKLPDEKAVAEYRDRLECIMREIATAEKNNDHAAQERLQHEKADLEAEIKRAARPGGKLRQPEIKTPVREAYNRVRGNLATALQAIADAGLPDLAAHLEHCITVEDYAFVYRPGAQPPQWHLSAA